jgi:hypothetical protein
MVPITRRNPGQNQTVFFIDLGAQKALLKILKVNLQNITENMYPQITVLY